MADYDNPHELISLGLNRPAPQNPAERPAEQLQFDRAEPVQTDQRHCAACHRVIPDQYYRFQDTSLCSSCAGALVQQNEPPSGSKVIWRAILFGSGAAAAGAILMYLVTAASGYQFSLLSIVIGFMVGRAVRKGADGRGSRKLQIVAALLTYMAVTGSYLPTVVHAVQHPRAQTQSATVATMPVKITALGYVSIFAICLAIPFLTLRNGFQAILGLFIIFVGVAQAWRLTQRAHLPLFGPYSVSTVQS